MRERPGQCGSARAAAAMEWTPAAAAVMEWTPVCSRMCSMCSRAVPTEIQSPAAISAVDSPLPPAPAPHPRSRGDSGGAPDRRRSASSHTSCRCGRSNPSARDDAEVACAARKGTWAAAHRALLLVLAVTVAVGAAVAVTLAVQAVQAGDDPAVGSVTAESVDPACADLPMTGAFC